MQLWLIVVTSLNLFNSFPLKFEVGCTQRFLIKKQNYSNILNKKKKEISICYTRYNTNTSTFKIMATFLSDNELTVFTISLYATSGLTANGLLSLKGEKARIKKLRAFEQRNQNLLSSKVQFFKTPYIPLVCSSS